MGFLGCKEIVYYQYIQATFMLAIIVSIAIFNFTYRSTTLLWIGISFVLRVLSIGIRYGLT